MSDTVQPTTSWDNRTLILSQSYRPHDVVDWKEAITSMFSGKIYVVVQYEEFIAHLDASTLRTFPELRASLKMVLGVDAEGLDLKVPAVAVLRRKIGAVKSGIKFSRINVAQRDHFCCQYCGERLPLSKLTYDHVVPRSQGGKTVWDNIVSSCSSCNSKKADRTVDESGMTPINWPVRPRVLPMAEPVIDLETSPPEWKPYLAGVNAA